MAYLDQLNISKRVLAAARQRRKANSVEYRREKLVANLEEQIELAGKAIAGEPLQLSRKRGHTVSTVKPRVWWRTDADGHVATEVYYDRVALRLANKGRTVEVGKLRKLPAVYRTLIRATRAGELDAAITAARARKA